MFIAITGSVGKTSTKNMLAELLSYQGKTFATKGNYNNHYGVPLTLANMPDDTEFAVIELGMSNAGEISELVKQVNPDVSLITTVAECHIEFFKSIDRIAYAKAEIFENLKGTAVINKTSPCFDILLTQAKKHTSRILTFGETPDCDVMLCKCNCKEDKSDIELEVRMQNSVKYTLPIPGKHMAINSCGVFAVLKALHLDLEEASKVVKKIQATDGRGAKTKVNISKNESFYIVDESYNASPTSMKASINNLSLVNEGRKILVLGDMLELGDKSKDLHLSILPVILSAKIDKVYCCGNFMKDLFDKLSSEIKGVYSDKSEDLIPFIKEDLKNKDNILIKGSHSMNMSLIVNSLKNK
jgi:UDP-N-acetylmuramoyl-tripeptide--D-alanyl-D-alanine ligase